MEDDEHILHRLQRSYGLSDSEDAKEEQQSKELNVLYVADATDADAKCVKTAVDVAKQTRYSKGNRHQQHLSKENRSKNLCSKGIIRFRCGSPNSPTIELTVMVISIALEETVVVEMSKRITQMQMQRSIKMPAIEIEKITE